jgi:hypothetical protein
MLSTPHSYTDLKDRWDSLTKRNGWHSIELQSNSEYPVLAIENDAARKTTSGGFYLSAGVHGDECAPVWALLKWAESIESSAPLNSRPLVILPCLNPYGLLENTRLDSRGTDLNRNFQNADLPLIGEWQRLLQGRQFDLAVNLHEDYDAAGIYLYELSRNPSIGDTLLHACEEIIPRETASEIDGTDMVNGLLERTDDIERIANEELGGWPESIWLYLKHSTNACTFETPSEMDLDRRIKAHRLFIENAILAHLP